MEMSAISLTMFSMHKLNVLLFLLHTVETAEMIHNRTTTSVFNHIPDGADAVPSPW